MSDAGHDQNSSMECGQMADVAVFWLILADTCWFMLVLCVRSNPEAVAKHPRPMRFRHGVLLQFARFLEKTPVVIFGNIVGTLEHL